jgi:membrane associated rhomboid family serine protease
VIGASAVASATMAAAVRFMFQPDAMLGSRAGVGDERPPHAKPALSLPAVFTDSRAVTFLIFWFVTNFIFGIVSGPGNIGGGAVAWQAHIGGFLFGLLAFTFFDPPYTAPHKENVLPASD